MSAVSALRSRWAIKKTVRPTIRRSIASWIRFSDSESTAEVASSRITYLRVLQEGAGQGEPLTLSAGNLDSALADYGIKLLGQFLHKGPQVREVQRLPHHFVGGILTRIAQVLAHAGTEEKGILAHQADALAQ